MIRIKCPTMYLFLSERYAAMPFLEALAHAQLAKWGDFVEGKDVYVPVDEELEVSFKVAPPRIALPPPLPEVLPYTTPVQPETYNRYNCPVCGPVEITPEEYRKQLDISGPWYCPKCKNSDGSPRHEPLPLARAKTPDDDIPL